MTAPHRLLSTGLAAVAIWIFSAPPARPAQDRPDALASQTRLTVPCDGAAGAPEPTPPGQPPAIAAIPGNEEPDWQPPACSGWSGNGARGFTVVAGSFKIDGEALILGKFGGVSHFGGIRYWSINAGKWDTLIKRAHAMTKAPGGVPRSDFSGSELASKRPLAYLRSDSDTGTAVYRMQVRDAAPDHVVIAQENAETIHRRPDLVFAPGQMQTLYVMRDAGHGIWTYYALTRASGDGDALTSAEESSLVNREVAMFRYMAGIPTAQNPPAMK